MNFTTLKALVMLAPTVVLFSGAVFLYARSRRAASLPQLLGAAFLMVVALTHLCEGLNLFPSMGWGAEDSIGHYVDLSSAVLGLSLFPIGYVFHALAKRRIDHVA